MRSWKIKSLPKTLPTLPEYPALILKLLAQRDVLDEQKIHDFLNPDFAKLHDPFLFKDMQKTVERIKLAVHRNDKITIYADYDADAITAAAVVYLALKKLGNTAEYYIPDRFSEGYGVNSEAIKQIAGNGTKLIITVDCGTNSVAEAKLCQELGVDLIITDHHEVTGELPEAYGLINPKNPTDQYPFTYLTGVGVAFKLVQAVGLEGYEKWLLDLVAIGTVADCQSLTSENRILVSFGLKVLAKSKWVGLRAMLATANGKENSKPVVYDTFTLGFILGPRINAAGRIKHGDIAFKLLVEEDPSVAEKLAAELNELNQHRQFLTQQVLSEARAQLETSMEKKVLLTVGKDWPKGVVGLVAGRLSEEFNRPVLAISTVEGLATGSARSTPEFDIVAALSASKDLLQKYGGHTQAAGFTLSADNLLPFHQRLLEYADSLDLPLSEKVLEIDLEILPDDVNFEIYEYLERLAPFGYGNPKPKFAGRGFEVLDIRAVGEGKHCKLKLQFGNHVLEAIGFNQGFLINTLRVGQKVDCAFELTTNEWNGNKQLQLKILDVKII